jgi:SAM-dependent methyltransferase
MTDSSVASGSRRGDPLRELIRTTARRYRRAGLPAFGHALGKLRFDPVFKGVLRQACFPDGARVLDLGCGQGLLLAWLIAAEELHRAGSWPVDWPAPPQRLQLHGIERQQREAAWGRSAISERGSIETGDLRRAVFPPSDVVVLLDVLHYFEPAEQLDLVQRVARCLAPQGRIIMRVADVGPRLSITLATDRLGTWLRGQPRPRYCVRPVDEWRRLLDRLGFLVAATPMSAGTPFCNVLLIATRAEPRA